MNREQLIAQAERLGIPRPRVLTQPELIDEIIARTAKNERERAKARGWLGRARDLLARVVEKGLHLPEAARALRGSEHPWPAPPPPLPTVTLAEIYAAQGHFDRAIAVLDEVIAREPDHKEAKALRARFVEQAQRSRSRHDRQAAAEAQEADRHAPSSAKPPAPGPAKAKPAEAQPPADPPAEAPPPSEVAAPPTEASAMDVHASPAPAGEAAHEPPPAPHEEAEPPSTEPAPALHAPSAPAAPAQAQEEEAAPTVAAGVTPVAAAAPPPPREPPAREPPGETPPPAREPPAEAPPPAEEPPAVEPTPAEVPPAETPPAVAEEAATQKEAPAAAAEIAPEPLSEPPLPQRYEVDEVVAIAVDPRTIYVYWEVRATTLAHAQAAHPGGALHLRIASVTASWEGPAAETRDLHVDSLYGDRFVRDIRPGSLIRVSVGWKSAGGFEPLAVGDELSAPRMLPVDALTHDVVRWEPAPVAPFQNPHPEPVDPEPRFARAPLHEPPAPPPSPAARGAVPPGAPGWAFEQRVAAARTDAEGRGGPVDTGVASWRSAELVAGAPPREDAPEATYEEDLPDAWWTEPGGASELARGLRRGHVRRPIPRAPAGPPAPPGASELARITHG